MSQTLSIIRPDDWHIHFRDGDVLAEVAPATARHFGRAIVMPNLSPPVSKVEMALAYRQRIMAHTQGYNFEPLMTLYLTDDTSVADVDAAAASGFIKAFKLYPANATTNSAHGVTDLDALAPVFERMAELGLLLLVHGEVTHDEVDIFDREKAFIDQHMQALTQRYTQLKIVFEHITTADAAQFVLAASDNVGATITPQHLMYNRNHLLVGGVRPHNFCLPILKRQSHQQALQEVVKSGHQRFFLGTDSAPHLRHLKENSCGCAGCYSAPAAIELYAHIFDEIGAIDKLQGFASQHGAAFYGLPENDSRITLVREAWKMPASIALGEHSIVPFFAEQTLNWKVQD
ncbi:dihydroorotase [Alginatibacterium sediminis]|uniref:Dihydroorotase n=1 Tax=Alginatibacterium sediminis TaxID=2164068 RepID=A0A420E8K0_9ALTE|nr:dihydroorotase [Alginatibacterium sediminis]RKF15819.1 dihydroorotase [Alginatibacterium sediminis]